MEVAPGVHQIQTMLGTRLSSLYLFAGDDAYLLFDTGVDGTAGKEVAAYLDAGGLDRNKIRWAVISHADVDHFGGMASVKEYAPNARLVCHRLDAPLIEDYLVYENERARGFRDPWGLDETPETLQWARSVTRNTLVDVKVTGGEQLRLSPEWTVEILHVPGHSRGHLAIHDPRGGVLAIADAVLGDAVRHASGTPAFPPTYRFVDAYLASIARLAAFEPNLLLTAHEPAKDTAEAAEFFARSTAFVERVDEAIVTELGNGRPAGCTLPELLTAINPRLGQWPAQDTLVALAFPVVGHLERMIEWGRIAGGPDPAGAYRMRLR